MCHRPLIYCTVLLDYWVVLGLGGPWVQHVEETTWVLGGFGPVIPIVLGSLGPMGRLKSTIPVSGSNYLCNGVFSSVLVLRGSPRLSDLPVRPQSFITYVVRTFSDRISVGCGILSFEQRFW